MISHRETEETLKWVLLSLGEKGKPGPLIEALSSGYAGFLASYEIYASEEKARFTLEDKEALLSGVKRYLQTAQKLRESIVRDPAESSYKLNRDVSKGMLERMYDVASFNEQKPRDLRFNVREYEKEMKAVFEEIVELDEVLFAPLLSDIKELVRKIELLPTRTLVK